MRKLIMVTVVFVLAGLSASYARGGMHRPGTHGLMTPANPTVPPSLTPDSRLTGTSPVPPHRQPPAADVSSLPDAMLKPTPEEAAGAVERKPCRRLHDGYGSNPSATQLTFL